MNFGKIFQLTFKVGFPLFLISLFALILIYAYSLNSLVNAPSIGDWQSQGEMQNMQEQVGFISFIVTIINYTLFASILFLFLSWLSVVFELFKVQQVEKLWKILWVVSIIIFPLNLIYYYFWGRKKLFSKKYQ